MNEINPLYVIAVVVGILGAYIIGWCNGSTFSKDDNVKSKTTESEIDRQLAFEFMLNEEVGKVYEKGWNDCYWHYKFNMKPAYKDYYQSKIDYSKMSDEELLKPDLK